MTDNELTALAARAFGEPQDGFSPLTDDGDALRLAVKLRLFDGRMFEDQRIALAVSKRLNFKNHIEEDEYAATRRAIVRAAAEIGREMDHG